jgi:hypothetical protein
MLLPPNVFAPKVSGTQSDATDNHPEQDIIETHGHYSLAIHSDSALMAHVRSRIKNDGAFLKG